MVTGLKAHRPPTAADHDPATSRPAPHWHAMDVEEVLHALKTSRKGLSSVEAEQRLTRHGLNTLPVKDRSRLWSLVVSQVSDVMILVLLAAAMIAWAAGDVGDAVLIGVVVVINLALGLGQHYRAERAVAALRELEKPVATVRRDERILGVPSTHLVPGDIMLVEAGDRVPADGRLIEAIQLRINESSLTGESVPASKHVRRLHLGAIPIGDRADMVFMGTTVAAGRATVIVTETGMTSELGKIAGMLQAVEEPPTPLQRRLNHLGKRLAVATVVLTTLVFVVGLWRGEPFTLMLLTAVSLAVAVIPEGLPAMVAIVLALGGLRMARRRALIRKLPAVETLGCVTTICSDKTGTLTQNVMSVVLIAHGGRLVEVTGDEYRPEGTFIENGSPVDPKGDEAFAQLLRGAALCTNASLRLHDDKWTVVGDPTEGALLVAAAKAGLWKETLEGEYPRIAELPFDSDRKLMTTIHRDRGGRLWVVTKGGIDEVLARSTTVAWAGSVESLTRYRRDQILRINRELSSDGVRVIACGVRELDALPSVEKLSGVESDLLFLGLFGMMDPPRPEARAAVTRCRQAGIRPVMITGDHRVTAEAIAVNLGIKTSADGVLTGEELERLDADALERASATTAVYARVSPEHKVKIVAALKRRGEVVAMTGDGVNDAPALKMADIGVAMGRAGTHVAREASHMVLMDDNFSTIVAAVEEGRMIYDNIRKFTRYMLSTNSGEILTVMLAMLVGLPIPLLPVQILWINLISDGLPALALGFEPPERAVMARPPRRPDETIFAGGMGVHIVWVGLLMGIGTAAVFAWSSAQGDLVRAHTMAFFTLTAFQMFHVLAIRSERESLWTIGLWSNPRLLAAVLMAVGAQLALTYSEFLQAFFHTTALTGRELALCTTVASSVFIAVEFEKWLRRRTESRAS
jgi:Ca2+-transporting ATPase